MVIFIFSWPDILQWARTSSLSRFYDHNQTHGNRQDTSGKVIGPAQKPLPDNTQHSQDTDIRALGGIRTHNPSKRAAAEPRLIPGGHLDRNCMFMGIRVSLST